MTQAQSFHTPHPTSACLTLWIMYAIGVPVPSQAYGTTHTGFELPPADIFEEDVCPQSVAGSIPEAQALFWVLLQQLLTEVLAGLAELLRILHGL